MKNRPNLALFLLSTLFVWGAFFFLWNAYGRPIHGIDDANIYLIYMRNWWGFGFVYNIGLGPVEGFTSLLWVLIGVVCHHVTFEPELALMVLSVLIINILMYRLNRELNWLSGSKDGIHGHHLFFMLLLLLIPGFFDWTLFTLMETALWAALLTRLAVRVSIAPSGFLLNRKLDNWIVAGLLFLLVLTRPESMLWGLLLMSIRVVYARYSGNTWKEAFRYNLLPLAVFAITLAALVFWRLSYFGYPFPNTYYAKVSAQPWDNLKAGLLYLVDYVLHLNPLIVFMLALITGWMYQTWRTGKRDPRSDALFVLSFICLLNFGFPLLTGGDHFYLGRILQPLMPLTFLVFTVLFFQLVQVKLDAVPDRILQGAKAVLFLTVAMLAPDHYRFYRYGNVTPPFQYEFYLAQKGRETGYQMSRFFEGETPRPVWGVVCAGGIAYEYEGETLDLMGLNNVAMAHASSVKAADRPKNHASFDKEVFYAQQPDIMFPTQFLTDTSVLPGAFEQSDTFQTDFFARALGHIHQDARFKSLYVPVVLTSNRKGDVLYAYFRRRFVEQLDTNEYGIRYLGN